jgi:hypothetical protein
VTGDEFALRKQVQHWIDGIGASGNREKLAATYWIK